MSKSEEYQVVVCYDIKELKKTVSEYIRAGYKPTGGVLTTTVGGTNFIMQAVYKEF